MKIMTTRGEMDESQLRKKEYDENDSHVVEYYLGEELVHRSRVVRLKGVSAKLETPRLG